MQAFKEMVSVIIPIYNVYEFIEKGLKQIFNQTYKDYEIILVDDGSTDGSYDECLKWSKTDERIRVLHQKNKGAGSARNLGIEYAKGEYIYFFDIDDEISNKLLEKNVSIMLEKNVDIVVFGYNNVETSFKSKVTVSFTQKHIYNNCELRDIFIEEFILKVNGFSWNKFYKKRFLDKHNLRYENQRIQQDEVFNLMCYQYVEKMYILSEVLYTYYIYEKGNTRSRFIADRFDIYKSVRIHFEKLKDYWNLNDKRLDDYLNNRFYTSVLQCMIFNILHPNCPWSKEEKKKEMNRIMSDPLTLSAFSYIDTINIGFEQKILKKICRNKSLFQLKLYKIVLNKLHILRKAIKSKYNK